MAKTMLSNLKTIVQDTLTDSIKMIDINNLHESADNFFVVDRIEEFADTILGQGGVKDNLIVRPLETGGYEIISGHRRRAAVQYLLDHGENISRYLPCLVQNYTDEDSRLLDIVLMNVSARQISDTEMWQSYELLNRILKEKQSNGEHFGRIREKLAELLGVSAAQIGKMENVAHNAIPEVLEAVQSGEISISTANEIAKMDESEQEKLVEQGVANVSHKEVKKKNQTQKQARSNERATYSTQPDDADKQDDESEECATCSTKSDDADEQEDDSEKCATCSTKQNDADEQEDDSEKCATCSTQQNDADEQEDNSEKCATCSTKQNDADEQEDDSEECATCSTQPDDADEQKDDSEECATCSTESDNESNLNSFIHEHYYELENVFTCYMSMTDDEEEISLLEEFQMLLKKAKEEERKKFLLS